ncbi:hypothetical protein TRIP_B40178 [uncultured Desulfatiglans sp.]|nr:hypothetical protein TRIP_B40178 [uncultured Desulfatiglans sp.]
MQSTTPKSRASQRIASFYSGLRARIDSWLRNTATIADDRIEINAGLKDRERLHGCGALRRMVPPGFARQPADARSPQAAPT